MQWPIAARVEAGELSVGHIVVGQGGRLGRDETHHVYKCFPMMECMLDPSLVFMGWTTVSQVRSGRGQWGLICIT